VDIPLTLIAPNIIVDLSLLFVFILALVFGWNNSGLTTGNLANLISYRFSLVLTLFGMFVGLNLEGSKMSQSLSGKLIVSTPQISLVVLFAGSLTSVIILLLFTALLLPASLSNCVIGSFAGAALATGSIVNVSFLVEVLISWAAVPILTAGFAIIIYEIITKAVKNFPLASLSWFIRLFLLFSVFYISYALGANNIGLISSMVGSIDSSISSSSSSSYSPSAPSLLLIFDLMIFVTVAAGVLIFGKSIAKIVGDKIVGLTQIKTVSAMFSTAFLTWVFTQFSIPLSLTQAVIGGMIGAGTAKGPTIFNRKKVLEIIASWVLVTALSALIAFLISHLILEY
jgi:PiT family inorganic phosphate transporter